MPANSVNATATTNAMRVPIGTVSDAADGVDSTGSFMYICTIRRRYA